MVLYFYPSSRNETRTKIRVLSEQWVHEQKKFWIHALNLVTKHTLMWTHGPGTFRWTWGDLTFKRNSSRKCSKMPQQTFWSIGSTPKNPTQCIHVSCMAFVMQHSKELKGKKNGCRDYWQTVKSVSSDHKEPVCTLSHLTASDRGQRSRWFAGRWRQTRLESLPENVSWTADWTTGYLSFLFHILNVIMEGKLLWHGCVWSQGSHSWMTYGVLTGMQWTHLPVQLGLSPHTCPGPKSTM